ncbi:B12-binding domain-containing radical SAM protein [bacterium]|nr:B12-binding domain-containing radical SAM protein [bacterium]
MSDIVLTTLNARYWHSSFGLRYLLANMGELQDRTRMLEFGIKDNVVEVQADILKHQPTIIGIGVYIWNVEPVTQLVSNLKQVSPETIIVLGGPEVSYDTEQTQLAQLADYVITGEADVTFPDLCRQILSGLPPIESTDTATVIHSPTPQLDQIAMPYDLYTDEDIAHRVIYVEVSRGCPFTCEFCLSALEIPVRLFGLDQFLASMQTLYDKGARQFKFVDRTFNLNIRVGTAILQFFLDRYEPGLFLHFEMIPDRLPDALRELIVQFPDGTLQFEIGVQTFNDDVGELISRRQDNEKLEQNFRFLRQQSGVHIHADLIVGLPGEDLESFGRGFDRLLDLQPQEIQVGILKRLKGTPIVRHDDEYQMVYSQHPPFEILSTRDVDFPNMIRLRHFARTWDLIGNSGNFIETRELFWSNGASAFEQLLSFSDWLVEREQRLQGISLVRLANYVFDFLTTRRELPEQDVAERIWQDYTRGGRRDRPPFLRPFDLSAPIQQADSTTESQIPKRQLRHSSPS